MNPKTKRYLLLAGLAVVALLLAGLITGEIGAKLIDSFSSSDSSQGERKGLLPKPEVVLPPEPVFPTEGRHKFEEWVEHGKEDEELKPFEPFQLFISNTILSSWVTTLVLIAIFLLGTRKLSLVPRGLQNFCEIIVEALLNFVEGVVGKQWGRRLFPVIATIFLFVAFNAWMGLLPIYPSLGFTKEGEVGLVGHLLRPAGTDMNMPLALALVSFVFVEMQGFRALGMHYLSKFVRVGSFTRGLKAMARGRMMDGFQGFIDFGFVGPLEAFSEFVRIISFTFRLFGNMTAGEILVIVSAFLVSFVATVGVYGLELLVGFVQALIFAGLTLVFASVALTPHGEGEH